MIGIADAFVLAQTKLRTRKVRTGIAIAVAGMLFGLLIAGVVIVQGVYTSVDRFGQQGLGARYILSASQTEYDYSRVDQLAKQPDMVRLFEKEHAELVEQKTAEAKRLGIDYNPEQEDPSPVSRDSDSGVKSINIYESANSQQLINRLLALNPDDDEFDIKTVADPYSPIGYPSASLPIDAGVTYMKDGREVTLDRSKQPLVAMPTDQNPYVLAVSDSSLVKPFISTEFDASRGEIPVVIPYSDAEKMLGLKQLPNSTPTSERLSRIYEVRDRIGEVTASFCYRNPSSQQLLDSAQQSEENIKLNQSKPDFVMPAVRYQLPTVDSCGAVEVVSDTRSVLEKQYSENRLIFDKKFNDYTDPVQHKITVRGVGITPDMNSAYSSGSMGGLAASLLSSYAEMYWSIPSDLLDQVPVEYRPTVIFSKSQSDGDRRDTWFRGELVEFGNFDDAQSFYQKYGCNFGACGSDGVMANPYGSSSLVLAEMRSFFDKAINYAVIFVSIFAMLILAGVIGRTIADGRKESAVFRAIGAKRSDLLAVYSAYTLMLAMRVVIFALILGLLVAWSLDMWQWQSATVGAQLAFGALDRSLEFHFFNIWSPYIVVIVVAMLIAALLAMIPPIIRAMRRDPIQDMRDDN